MIHQSGTTLSASEIKSISKIERTETALIRKFFNANSGKFTSEEVHANVFPSYQWHEKKTNIRRTLTDLKDDGFLIKDEKNKKKGSQGVMLCTYQRNRSSLAQGLLFCVEEICKDYKKKAE